MTTQETIEAINDVTHARRDVDLALELQGVYRYKEAEKTICVKTLGHMGINRCQPANCMAWRRVDEEHGYCVFIGCSWREGIA
jgi:hypothetical protein